MPLEAQVLLLEIQRFGKGTEFIVPRLTEAADKRFAKELVYRYVKFLTLANSIATDVPTVVVQTDGTIGKTLDPDGIKRTGDGLHEARTTFTASLFKCTETKRTLRA